MGGALKAGLQQQRGRRRDLGALSFKYSGLVHFFSKLQTAALKDNTILNSFTMIICGGT